MGISRTQLERQKVGFFRPAAHSALPPAALLPKTFDTVRESIAYVW